MSKHYLLPQQSEERITTLENKMAALYSQLLIIMERQHSIELDDPTGIRLARLELDNRELRERLETLSDMVWGREEE